MRTSNTYEEMLYGYALQTLKRNSTLLMYTESKEKVLEALYGKIGRLTYNWLIRADEKGLLANAVTTFFNKYRKDEIGTLSIAQRKRLPAGMRYISRPRWSQRPIVCNSYV